MIKLFKLITTITSDHYSPPCISFPSRVSYAMIVDLGYLNHTHPFSRTHPTQMRPSGVSSVYFRHLFHLGNARNVSSRRNTLRLIVFPPLHSPLSHLCSFHSVIKSLYLTIYFLSHSLTLPPIPPHPSPVSSRAEKDGRSLNLWSHRAYKRRAAPLVTLHTTPSSHCLHLTVSLREHTHSHTTVLLPYPSQSHRQTCSTFICTERTSWTLLPRGKFCFPCLFYFFVPMFHLIPPCFLNLNLSFFSCRTVRFSGKVGAKRMRNEYSNPLRT